MSSEYYDFTRTRENIKRMKFDSTKSYIDGYGKGEYIPREPCEWTPNIRDKLLTLFGRMEYPFRRYESLDLEDPLRSEVRRFLLSLDAYIESGQATIPYKYILLGSTDINFSQTLKRIKRKAIIKSFRAELYSKPDWWENIPTYHINDIGEIFNYSYLIFWKKPDDEIEDYKHGFEDLNQDQRWLDAFRENLRDMLPDTLEEIDKNEVLFQISSSSCYSKGKSRPHFLEKPKNLSFNSKRTKCKRSIIHVSPENVRDSVLVSPNDLNTISLLDKQVLLLLENIESHIHLKNKDRVTSRLKRFDKKFMIYIQRDIKKEGITKPRNLLKIMLEELNNAYPEIKIFQNTAFYDRLEIIMQDGSSIFPKRGHGLGMANALTTLMQLVIFNVIVDELLNDIPDLDIGCLALNDDYVVGCNDQYHADEYWDLEDEVLKGLGILREPQKSFLSRSCFTIAERYFYRGVEHEKLSYQFRELLLPLSCFNIVHAKDYYSSCQTFVNDKYRRIYMSEYQSYWGYEFFSDEYDYPTIFGGWDNDTIRGIDMSIYNSSNMSLREASFRSYEASKVRFKRKRGGDIYLSPLILIYGNLDIPEHLRETFDYMPIKFIKEKYGRNMKNVKYFKKYWNYLYKERQRVFKQETSKSLDDIYLEIIKENPQKCYYPADYMIESYKEAVWKTNFDIRDPYIDPNPKMAALAKYNLVNYPFKEEFSISFSNRDNFTNVSKILSKEVQRSLSNRTERDYLFSERDQFMFPTLEENLANESYINPIGIGAIASRLIWHKGYPIIRSRYRSPLIEEKRAIFNRFLSLEELIFITEKKLSREMVKELTRLSENFNIMQVYEYAKILKSEKKTMPPVYKKKDIDRSDEDYYLFKEEYLVEEYCPFYFIYAQHDGSVDESSIPDRVLEYFSLLGEVKGEQTLKQIAVQMYIGQEYDDSKLNEAIENIDSIPEFRIWRTLSHVVERMSMNATDLIDVGEATSSLFGYEEDEEW